MKHKIQEYKLPIFFVLTILIGWAPWVTGTGYIIFAAPTISAIILAYATEGKEGLRKIWTSLAKWRTKPVNWLAAVLIPAITSVVSLGVHSIRGGTLPGFPLFDNPAMLALTFIMFMLPWQSSAFMEEIGFRGYALEELQNKIGPLKGTLVLGFFFGAWLLPEFYKVGSAQHALGLGYYPWFIVTEIGFSLLMTWVYNRSGKSSLVSGVIMHVAMNYWPFILLTDIIPGQTLPVIDSSLWIVTAIVVAAFGVGVSVATKGNLGYQK